MKQTLLQRGTNTAACMLFLVLLFLSFSCIESPTEFIAPTFDTQLTIPVLDTTQYFSNIAKKYPIFTFDSTDSTYSLSFTTGLIPIDSITNPSERRVTLEDFTVKGLSMKFKNNSVIDGIMNYEFTNGIPLVLKFQMSYLKWDSAEAHSDTLFKISPSSDSIQAPDVDPRGVAISPKISNIAVVLTGAQIDTMARADSVFMKLYFNIGNGLNSVKYKRDNYIRIRSSVNVRCTINKP
jgi:hypothetical protein